MQQPDQNSTKLRMRVRINNTCKLGNKVKLKGSILTHTFSSHLLKVQIQGLTPLLDIP